MNRGKDVSGQERIAPEELDAIRSRLAAPSGGRPDDLGRLHAATVDDVAEALGVASADVRRQLDRIREEKAFRPKEAPRRQSALLAFAAVLLGTAYGIFRLTPHKLSDEEIDAKTRDVREQNQERRRRNPVVHYPIVKVVETEPLAPVGFPIEFRGTLTTTRLQEDDGPLKGREETQKALAEALAHACEEAQRAESTAPPPKRALNSKRDASYRYAPEPGAFSYSLGPSTGYFSLTSQICPNEMASSPTPESFARTAGLAVENAIKMQDGTLANDPPVGSLRIVPPAGYTVLLSGRGHTGLNRSPLLVLPLDEGKVERKLTYVVQDLLRRDFDGSDLPVPLVRPTVKSPEPDFVEITLVGPSDTVVIRLPQKVSSENPTAADLLRMTDRLVAEGVRKAASQIGRLNRQAEEGVSRP